MEKKYKEKETKKVKLKTMQKNGLPSGDANYCRYLVILKKSLEKG